MDGPLPADALNDANVRGLLRAARQVPLPAWTPPEPEVLQHSLPAYRIVSLLGRGGMGAVYRGVQLSLERPVAVKILPAELDDEHASFAGRFKREAHAMGRLSHPGIVPLLDAGSTADGLLYLVMEFVTGMDLARLLAAQRRPPQEMTREVLMQLCDALHFAHGQGVVHRDVKPSNIIIGPHGRIKVVDFGLAKLTDAEGRFTQTNVAIGTPEFQPPEVSLGTKHLDHRADIYAAGVLLYLMLTGRLPRGKFDPPSQTVPGVDGRFDTIVSEALRAGREQRYATALEMQEALASVPLRPWEDFAI